MKPGDADRISEALVLWVGPIPSLCYKRKAALSARFGATEAAALEPIVRALEEDLFASDARHVAADLQEMHRLACADFKRKHPELSDAAINALAASYTFTYK